MNLLPSTQAILQTRDANPQNTFYDMLSQSSRVYKNSSNKKFLQQIPLSQNGYYYDPNMIERQNKPCFKIEKVVKKTSSSSGGGQG